jgi:hypothetical protein
MMGQKEEQGAPAREPIHLYVVVQCRPALHLMLPTLSLGIIQEKIKAVFGIDVTKPPAYLIYRFDSMKDENGGKLWCMVHSQEELEYVAQRSQKTSTRFLLQVVDDFAVFQKKK